LPEFYLISNSGETKKIFREAMRGIVPNVILDRKDKIGFATPERDILFGMEDQIKGWISSDLGLPFLNQIEISKQFNLALKGKLIPSQQVWRWINFIRWYQLYF
jgi:asparagine synthase (glutamine-hydrolysing)